MSRSLTRSIILTNSIALISAALCTVVLVYIGLRAGWTWSSSIILITIASLLSILFLNFFQAIGLSRFILSIILPVVILILIFIPRIPYLGEYEYMRTPTSFSTLLAVSIIPLIIFSLRERALLFTGLTVNFIILMLLDPVIYFFSKKQALEPYSLSTYLSNNFIILIAYSFLTGSVTFLKNLFERFEVRNENLILRLNQKNAELEESNSELYKLNQEIETQNEEMQAQSEELLQSQDSLMVAHREIERQKMELENKNYQLEQTLDEKSRDLLITNQHLASRNNELQQFSYTVSHNLRGPVASMLGLINIYRLSKSDEERATVLNLLNDSTVSLETIIKDLNKIIDVRNDKFSVMEQVNLHTELELITRSLKTFIDGNHVTIQTDLLHPEVLSVKAYINSILYNLISNALQYRSPDRPPVIRVSSRKYKDHIVIEVKDNGLGIDLEKHGDDMFKLYKRFHNHIQGKGLGLYLVRQQVEKLNGHIEVDSKLDEGTTFRVYHK